MANRYTGIRKSTLLEMTEIKIAGLEARERLFTRQIDELLAVMTAVYRKSADPDICRQLVVHGVDVWSIDRELGRETRYTTARMRYAAEID